MKQLSISLVCICVLLSGCSLISTALTPASVIDTVARGHVVSKASVQTPPTTPQDMTAYHEINAELWRQLAIWYGLVEEEE